MPAVSPHGGCIRKGGPVPGVLFMAVITLLTDFGLKDPYVGVMKGVILSIAPAARIVDITHGVDGQDVLGAAYVLASAFPFFPKNSVHAAVVDPGVGSDRKIVAVSMAGQICLAPDNGVLSLLYDAWPVEKAVYVENPRYFLPDVSATFHGRDVFAPVAARLWAGLAMEELGPPVLASNLARIDLPEPKADDTGISGRVIWVDGFGNLVTDISAALLDRFCPEKDRRRLVIRAKGVLINGLASCYARVPEGALLALVGSGGRLEISVNKGSAARVSGLGAGDAVRIEKN